MLKALTTTMARSSAIISAAAKTGLVGKNHRNVISIRRYVNGTNWSRNVSTTPTALNPQAEEVQVTFVRANGERIKAKGKIGDSLLDVVVNNNLDFDGFGACEGTLTCSTCHLIFSKPDFDRLPEKASDEELDMLDLAYDLSDTSRLGCQIILSKDLEGLEIKVPATINDARS